MRERGDDEMIQMEYPKLPLDGLTPEEKVVALKRQVDILTDNLQIVLNSIEDDIDGVLTIRSSGSDDESVEAGRLPYGYCQTAAGTAAKTVTVDPAVTSLYTGLTIAVKFQYANSVANPTLNVNGLGAKAIERYGTTSPSTSAASSWNANSVIVLTYDGTYWQMAGWLNTTYSGMSEAEYKAGTGTSSRLITPARLKGAIKYWSIESLGDYVVEEGTHNLWEYVKWNSGRIELWGKFTQTVTSYATNAWVIGHASLTNYPSGITNPIAVATCQKIGTGGGVICYDYERTDYWSGIANNFNGTIAQGESRAISWYVYVNARWK